MKLLLLSTLVMGLMSAPDPSRPTENVKNILIGYLSRTGNTKAVAELIQQEVEGMLVSLALKKPYPENYQQTVQ